MKPKDDSCRGCAASEVGRGRQATGDQLLIVEGGGEDEELKMDYIFSSLNMSCNLLLSR